MLVGAHDAGCVVGQILDVVGDLLGVAEEDNEVIHVEGVVKSVKVRVDLKGAAGYVRVEHDLPLYSCTVVT